MSGLSRKHEARQASSKVVGWYCVVCEGHVKGQGNRQLTGPRDLMFEPAPKVYQSGRARAEPGWFGSRACVLTHGASLPLLPCTFALRDVARILVSPQRLGQLTRYFLSHPPPLFFINICLFTRENLCLSRCVPGTHPFHP